MSLSVRYNGFMTAKFYITPSVDIGTLSKYYACAHLKHFRVDAQRMMLDLQYPPNYYQISVCLFLMSDFICLTCVTV